MELKEVSFCEDQLKGTYIGPSLSLDCPRGNVLFIHGWNSDRTAYIKRAEALAGIGYHCLAFDLRGHGKSEGNKEQLTIEDHVNDVVQACQFLRRHFIPRSVNLVGASYGGMLAALMTMRLPVARLVLRAPTLFRDQDFARPSGESRGSTELQAFRGRKVSWEESTVLESVHYHRDRPAMLIRSELDEVIPATVIESYRDAFPNPALLRYEVMQGAPHSLKESQYQQAFVDLLVDFFSKAG